MTNAEKFKEVFGFEFNKASCVMPASYECPECDSCEDCPYGDWADKEYTGKLEIKENKE